MKKNIVGHMMAPKESKISRFKRLDLFPRILCLLLALVIWLLVVNVQAIKDDKEDKASSDRGAVEDVVE